MIWEKKKVVTVNWELMGGSCEDINAEGSPSMYFHNLLSYSPHLFTNSLILSQSNSPQIFTMKGLFTLALSLMAIDSTMASRCRPKSSSSVSIVPSSSSVLSSSSSPLPSSFLSSSSVVPSSSSSVPSSSSSPLPSSSPSSSSVPSSSSHPPAPQLTCGKNVVQNGYFTPRPQPLDPRRLQPADDTG